MHIIPVIDLKGGEVVRAERGLRHLYAPIRTPLAPTSRAEDVVAGFLALHTFYNIYIADLDAIEGRSDHAGAISALEAAFPSVTFWVDGGIAEAASARSWLARHRGDLVMGSETLQSTKELAALAGEPRAIFSVDFRDGAYLGPAGLDADESLWPERVIVMSLARVGSGAGPETGRLQEYIAKAETRHSIYAAGGLRGEEDLLELQKIGVRGVLVASALHEGRLDTQMLQKFAD